MQGIVLILVLAVTVEALVEYGKSILNMRGEQDGIKAAVTQLCALAVSVFMCIAASADLYEALGVTFRIPYVGCILTGIFASRGANYVSDLTGRLRK